MEAASTVPVGAALSKKQLPGLTGAAVERDIENQQVSSEQRRAFSSPAPVIEAEPLPATSSSVIPANNAIQPPDIVFVESGMVEGGPSYVYYVGAPVMDDPHEGWLWCAIIGCVFAWMPIVGCITFCFNADAYFGTLRRKYSSLALSISFISLCFNLLFWPLFFFI
jgi:hypothetical protein